MIDPSRAPAAHSPGASVAVRRATACPWISSALAFAVYGATVAPTIGFGDSPELSAAALSLGVPHPTGYPLLMLLGYGFSSLFATGDPAWRLNLLGALLASAAVGFSAAFVQRLTGRAVAGWVAGLLLAFAPVFWSNATLFEVYGLHVLFVAALLFVWLRFEQDPVPSRLRLLAFMAGLSLTHHLMIGLLLPILAIAVLRHARVFSSAAELARLGVLFVLPLGLFVYLPLAALADPSVNWGDPSTSLRFWSHVTGRQYHGNLAGEASITGWQTSLDLLRRTTAGPTPLVFALTVLGVLWPFVDRRRLADADAETTRDPLRIGGVVLVALLAVGFGFGSFYQVVDRESFFINAVFATSLLAGVGVALLLDWTRRLRASAVSTVTLLAALLPVLPLWLGWSGHDRSHDFAAHDRAVALMQTLPPDALLLVEGHEGYPVVYASLIAGLRPDVLVVDCYLRIRGDGGGYGPELERIRYLQGLPAERIVPTVTATAAALGRPLFMLATSPDVDWEELGLVRVRRGVVDQLIALGSGRLPIGSLPEGEVARFENGPVLLAARVGRGRIEPGDATSLQLEWAWTGEGEPEDWTVWVVAGDAEGRMLEDERGVPLLDHTHPLGQGVSAAPDASRTPWLESVALVLPRDTPEGSTSLFAALTRDGELVPTLDDRAFVRIGTIDVAPRTRSAWRLAPKDASPHPGEHDRRVAEVAPRG